MIELWDIEIASHLFLDKKVVGSIPCSKIDIAVKIDILVCLKTTCKRYNNSFLCTCPRSGLGILNLQPVRKVNVVVVHSALTWKSC